jgi:histidine ammonia-lyase
VSMGTNDARHAWGMVQDVERVQGIELLCATQALDYRLQILDAAQKLATNVGVQGLRSKIRGTQPMAPSDAEALAADVKRLQADLKKLSTVSASPVAVRLMQHVRNAGVHFMAHDRLLSTELDLAISLIQSRALLRLVEQELKISLELQD